MSHNGQHRHRLLEGPCEPACTFDPIDNGGPGAYSRIGPISSPGYGPRASGPSGEGRRTVCSAPPPIIGG